MGSYNRLSLAPLVKIEAELRSPAAWMQIIEFNIQFPLEGVLVEDNFYHLDLSLSPRPAAAKICFMNQDANQRMEHPGQVFLIPPGEALKAESGVGRPRSLKCHLSANAVREWLHGDLEWTASRLKASLNVASPVVRTTLLQLADEIRNPGFSSEIFCESLFVQLAVSLHRYYINIAPSVTPSEAPLESGKLCPWRLKLINERIEDEAHAPTLLELSKLCKLSVRQLSRAFRASCGLTIGKYVAERRFDRAKCLLRSGSSVKSVAYTLGFASPSAFCHAFRTRMAISPEQYRKQAGH